MTLQKAWDSSAGLKIVLWFIGGLILAGVSGIWVMNAKISLIEGKIEAFQRAAIQDHERYDRHLERAAAGPGR